VRVITFNANGIRSAAQKGFFRWMHTQAADILCLQETRAWEHQLSAELFRPAGYHAYFFDAQKPGYSGVALYSKQEPDRVIRGLNCAMDSEGRYIQADYGPISIASLYMPSGSSGPVCQAIKYEFMDFVYNILVGILNSGRDYLLCGDWNIAHNPIDLKNWRSNQKNSGFLPQERAWLDKVFYELGWVDAFRVVNQEPEQYTWWSNRGRAWEKDVGWRIDYQLVTPGLKDRVLSAYIHREQRFSDHAPLVMDYDLWVTGSR
jgi:exodeoxyribonuclease-3